MQEVAVVRRGDPSPGAQKVLMLILDSAADGTPWVSQAALASALGQSPEWVAARYGELQACGLVAFQHQGNQPARPLPNVELLRSWLAGTPLVYPEIAGAVLPEIAGTNGPVQPEKAGALARGATSSSSSSSSAGGSSSPTGSVLASAELDAELESALAILKRFNVPVSFGSRPLVRELLEMGHTGDDVRHCAQQTDLHVGLRGPRLRYFLACMEEIRTRAGANVVGLEGWAATRAFRGE